MSDGPTARQARIDRETRETKVGLALDLGGGEVAPETGIGFFDHMLELLGRHANVGLAVRASGDLATGGHHTVEDVGIALGQALDRALGDRAGIERYGAALVPMDECLVQAAIDISGRPFVACHVALPATVVGGFETDLLEEFLRGVANHAKLALHLRVLAGENPHHVIEACFKAFARALRAAVTPNLRAPCVPSTKGSL